MGLKQLLIILMLFGTGSSIYSLVNADSESEAKKGITARQDFDMIICCRSV
jgi:hypothetical protein